MQYGGFVAGHCGSTQQATGLQQAIAAATCVGIGYNAIVKAPPKSQLDIIQLDCENAKHRMTNTHSMNGP